MGSWLQVLIVIRFVLLVICFAEFDELICLSVLRVICFAARGMLGDSGMNFGVIVPWLCSVCV